MYTFETPRDHRRSSSEPGRAMSPSTRPEGIQRTTVELVAARQRPAADAGRREPGSISATTASSSTCPGAEAGCSAPAVLPSAITVTCPWESTLLFEDRLRRPSGHGWFRQGHRADGSG